MLCLIAICLASFSIQALANTDISYGLRSFDPLVYGNKIMVDLPGKVEVEIENGYATYAVTDHIQSARVAVSEDNTVSEQINYTPFGDSRINNEIKLNGYYTGQSFEPETATYDYHARVYDPSVVRFLSLDSKREDASPYVYVGNNPISFVDFTGAGKIPFILFFGDDNKTSDYEFENLVSITLAKDGSTRNRVLSSDAFFSDVVDKETGEKRLSKSFKMVKNFLSENSRGLDMDYSDKFFWFIADNDKELVFSDEMVKKLSSLRDSRKSGVKDFATDITIVDMTSDEKGHEVVFEKLKAFNGGKEPLLIKGKAGGKVFYPKDKATLSVGGFLNYIEEEKFVKLAEKVVFSQPGSSQSSISPNEHIVDHGSRGLVIRHNNSSNKYEPYVVPGQGRKVKATGTWFPPTGSHAPPVEPHIP